MVRLTGSTASYGYGMSDPGQLRASLWRSINLSCSEPEDRAAKGQPDSFAAASLTDACYRFDKTSLSPFPGTITTLELIADPACLNRPLSLAAVTSRRRGGR